jgi:hypothetical protein
MLSFFDRPDSLVISVEASSVRARSSSAARLRIAERS